MIPSMIALYLHIYTATQPRGHWLVDKYYREADCTRDALATTHVDYVLWDKVHEILTGPATIDQLTHVAQGLLIPVNGLVDPTLALQCPLGTAAVLQALGLALVQSGVPSRGLRVLHLAKLFAFHKYPELGDGIEQTRWKLGIMDIMNGIKFASPFASSVGGLVGPTERGKTVTIVSYCYYPGGRTKLPEYSKGNKEKYGAISGIKVVHHDKPFSQAGHAWMNKLLAVETAMSSEDSDWVMWVDCDAYFMNKHFDINNFLSQVPKEKQLIISEDANHLNSAVFLLRNTEWSRHFLKNVRNLLTAPSPFSFRDNAYHEQSPLMYLVLVPSVFDGANPDGYAKEVLIVDQKMMNAYPVEIAHRSSFMQHAMYEPGDWIISFNGCGSLLGGEYCEEIWKSHFEQSMLILNS